jgi:DMSO reductase anchor subunit
MKPEFSVIFLTTLIGAGQGLLVALFAAQVGALSGLLPGADARAFHAAGALLALLFTGLGLFASFFHLGRPERGWRAIAQWRTSWLSREVLVLPAFMAAVFAYGVAHWAGWRPVLLTLPAGAAVDATLVLGAVAVLLAFALFLCTGMVYACLPFLREWASPLTVINFTLLGLASGFTLAAGFAGVAAPDLVRFFGLTALAFTLLAAVGRGASLVRNDRLKPRSTIQTALGIKHPRIVQISPGFQGGSFNTREFFHGRSRAALRAVKWGFVATVFAIPALLLAAGVWGAAAGAIPAAFAVQYAGLLAERWFFFAQANHPQNLYYQAIG